MLPVLPSQPQHAKSCGSEPFILAAVASLLIGSIWLYQERELLLGHFYRPELLSITHTLTLGWTTLLVMGMLARLSPRALGVPFRSKRLLLGQFVLMLVGTTGMVFHFWFSGWIAMALAAILIVAAASIQIVNFSRVFRLARREWLARYVAASLVHFWLAAVLGVLLGFNKVYDVLPGEFFPSVFAHAHLAAVGWVSMMILGFEHRLLPSSRPTARFEPAVRFWALEIGLLGLVASLLTSSRTTPLFVALIVAALALHARQPVRLLLTGRVAERASAWATAALLFAVSGGIAGMLLACGIPDPTSPLRARVQFAYGYVGLFGWIALTITSQSFKLFPVFLQEERAEKGLPLLSMEEVRSRSMETLVAAFLTLGTAGAAAGIVTQSIFAITFFHGMVVLGVLAFAINFARMARRHFIHKVGRVFHPLRHSTALFLFLLLGLSGCSSQSIERPSSGPIDLSLAPARHLESSERLLELGRAEYARNCAPCHGSKGDGLGEAAYLLYPKPRDFTMGQYRLVSTWDNVPTDEDLYRTISRGMPGSAMPPWAHLDEETRWGLVHYVKSFSRMPLRIRPARNPASLNEEGRGIVQVPPEPPYDAPAEARAREVFLKGCAPCHGAGGRGDGTEVQIDSKGFPTRPRDLTAGIYKGSPEPEHVYRRLVAGLPGSPMPQNPYLHGLDGWHLTHYVRALSSDEQRAKVEMRKFRIVAPSVPEIPIHPDSGVWRSAEAVNLHLMPLWWRSERPETLTVKAVHSSTELALLLAWADATPDETAMRPQDFRDAAAIEFSLTPNPPFFAMGERGAKVNIWMWKAERQADLETTFQDLEKVYPNLGIDSYPNVQRSALEQPARHALTLQSDPTFVTAWGARNIVADPLRRSAAEDLTAEGFGTLRARPKPDPAVAATGVHTTGSYQVVFRRRLDAGRGAAAFRIRDRIPVSFAVWNGSAGDRDGKKSVTIWQELVLAP